VESDPIVESRSFVEEREDRLSDHSSSKCKRLEFQKALQKVKRTTLGFCIFKDQYFEINEDYKDNKLVLSRISPVRITEEIEKNVGAFHQARGCTVMYDDNISDGIVYVTTFLSGRLLLYEASTLNKIGELRLPEGLNESYGITSDPNDNTSLLISDGQSLIYKVSRMGPSKILSMIRVSKDGVPIEGLTSIAFRDNEIWCVQSSTSVIIIIDSSTGEYKRMYSLDDLQGYESAGSLTSIQWINNQGMMTGRDWDSVLLFSS